jgi:molecular chaperone GrpE
LKPDAVSAVLTDFQKWLTALTAPPPLPSPTRGEGEEETPSPTRGEGEEETPSPLVGEGRGGGAATIDLHTLLGQFVAVRQEVNLQTRAVRAQQEQNAETLRQLTTALDALRQSQGRHDQAQQQAVEEAVRPLLKTLLDLYDALALADREVQRLRQTVQSEMEQLAEATTEAETPSAPAVPRSFWASLFRPSAPDAAAQAAERERRQQRERLSRARGARARQMLASLVTGYTMSLQRVERALRQHGLEAIPTTGARFDPERMEVVEAVTDSDRPSGEVIEEVRRGYLWNGRVFRYAQVRVAKG